jgi:hypothetical protein
LMKQGSNRELAFQHPDGGFGLGQLHVLGP